MSNRKILSSRALLMLTFTAIFSFSQVVNNSVSIGLASIPSFLFATLMYFIPFAFMIAEFASAHPDNESGYTKWIEGSLGPKWAFLASWTYFFVNLFFFSSLLPGMLISLSYAFLGQNIWGANDNLLISVISIALFWGATWVTTKGAKGISFVTNISGIARFAMGLIFIVFAFVLIAIFKTPPAQEITLKTMTPDFSWAYFATFAWILQAVGGAESVAVYIKDLKGGTPSFIKTMIFSAFFVGIIYVLGCLAVGLIIPAETLAGNYSNAIYIAFETLGKPFGINAGLVNIVGVILFLAAAGSVVLWASAPVKIFFSEVPKGILPGGIDKVDENGTPVKALYLQAIVVTVLLLIPGLGISSIDTFLKFLINMTAATALLPMIFFFVAYINFRKNHDQTPRSFRLSKNPKVGIFFGVLLLIFFGLAFVTSLIPDPSLISLALKGEPMPAGETNPFFAILYQVGGVVVFLGYAWKLWSDFEKKKIASH
ncbi:MAG: amino acid permease [Spirochaetia bacterium]